MKLSKADDEYQRFLASGEWTSTYPDGNKLADEAAESAAFADWKKRNTKKVRCEVGGGKPDINPCCSSHNTPMCSHHYAVTHFVETSPDFLGPGCNPILQISGKHATTDMEVWYHPRYGDAQWLPIVTAGKSEKGLWRVETVVNALGWWWVADATPPILFVRMKKEAL